MAVILTLPRTISKGLCGLPGGSSATKDLVESLLYEDYQKYHCFFNTMGFHNHLSHHVLAAYDLGAPSKLLQSIYDSEAKDQRPIDLDGKFADKSAKVGDITSENWTERLGEEGSYAAYLDFFAAQIARHGSAATFQKFVLEPSANGNGTSMLARLVAGLLHPIIQIGHGVEFNADFIVAEGLAQTAMHVPASFLFDESETLPTPPPKDGVPSLFTLLKEVYDSTDLVPSLPYDRNSTFNTHIKRLVSDDNGRRAIAARQIAKKWVVMDIQRALEECTTLATCLTAGTSRAGHTPRIDFFLIHTLTSSHFLRPVVDACATHQQKVQILHMWFRTTIFVIMIRGRPRIDPALLMSYPDVPSPPLDTLRPGEGALSVERSSQGAWQTILADALHHPEAHVIKTVRSLYHAATLYGERPAGWLVPKGQEETHKGLNQVDGSIFLRAAGVTMDQLGWTTYGQKPGEWDISGLGWDDTWK